MLLLKSCISEPHLCKVTSVLYRDIFTFAQSSPKQALCSSSRTEVTQPHSGSPPLHGEHDLAQLLSIHEEHPR